MIMNINKVRIIYTSIFRHPFANAEGKFNMLRVLTGKYDLIERKDIDGRLKDLCYRMIKLVRRYIHTYKYIHIYIIYIYNCMNMYIY
jgi:hypothetical protein